MGGGPRGQARTRRNDKVDSYKESSEIWCAGHATEEYEKFVNMSAGGGTDVAALAKAFSPHGMTASHLGVSESGN